MPIGVKDKDGAPQTISTIDDLIALVGAVVASPATNTLQDRLKALATKLDTLHTDLATTLAGYVDGLEALTAAATPAGENHIGEVGGASAVVAAAFNRPADTTAYAIGDLVANNVTAGSVAPMTLAVSRALNKTGMIRRGRLTKSNSSVSNAIFRAHFYKDTPTATNGDNGAFQTGGALTYIGSMDFDMTGANARAFSDGVKCLSVPNVGSEIVFDPSAGTVNIFALIEARGTYAPASAETFTLALEVLRD